MTLKLLTDPFIYIAGWRALFYGCILSGVITFLMTFTGTHFNGLSTIHFAGDSPYWVYAFEYLAGWLAIALWLYLAGLLGSKSNIRIVDIFGTTLLARGPLLLMPAARLLPLFNGLTYTYYPIYLLIGLYVLSVIWSVSLSFKAFQVSCNPKKNLQVYLFIGGLFIAEILTKISIYKFIYP